MKEFSIIFNRLKKNHRRLKPYLKKYQIEAFRLYEKDIPEYPFIVDLYGPKIVVFDKGKKLQPEQLETAKKHQQDLFAALAELYPDKEVIFKLRERQKGKNQYKKLESSQNFFHVHEGKLRFRVNLHDYLDSGLFLDHRPLRFKLIETCKNLNILNLFCYTGSLSVAAAMGGAVTTSVDMSQTYLNWAQQNFKINQLVSSKHQFIRADVMSWINAMEGSYDLILLDPPSFSNSKKMPDSFNVQDHHEQLIRKLACHLKPQGEIFFSNNFKKFKLADALRDDYQVDNLSDTTIPQDFRDKKIHHSFQIKNK